MRRIAGETIPPVIDARIRFLMKKFGDEWFDELHRDREFKRLVVDHALRAFHEETRRLTRGRRRRSRSPAPKPA